MTDEPAGSLEMVIITGLSGAGRSEAARCLEDLGWFVVDNLPPSLLGTMAELASRSHAAIAQVAVVVDVRGRGFFADLREGLEQLKRAQVTPYILFLEADDGALVRRFEHVRRPHPLQADGRLIDGIARERALTDELRGMADLVVDTTDLNVHQLRDRMDAVFAVGQNEALRVSVVSFGYKYGLPVDAEMVVDCRFLPNPHWIPDLRPRTGQDEQVRDYVLGQPGAVEFLDRYAELLALQKPGYLHEGKHYLTLAVGCTGGKHRSVVMAEQLAARLAEAGAEVKVVHRDLGRE
ncbi:MAG: RNase adapter protein RapZ [Frankiaceae bacterium]|nr:RNase adapter protein RapZ [Frankiaceae bacterium]